MSHLSAVTSDHCTLLLNLNSSGNYGVKRYIHQFENVWLKEQDCRNVIMTSWNRTALLEFSTRLRLCCDELWEWGAKFRRRFSRRKQIFRVRMNQYRGSVTTMGQTLFSSACREYGLLPD